MEAKLTFKYDREADILHIDKCLPYTEQDSEELGDDVIARPRERQPQKRYAAPPPQHAAMARRRA